MHKAFLVMKREFTENLRTKTFWIGILAFPLIFSVAVIAPTLLERTKGARKFTVIDQSGWLLPAVQNVAAIDDVNNLILKLRDGEKSDYGDSTVNQLAEVVNSSPDTPAMLIANYLMNPEATPDGLPGDLQGRLTELRADMGGWWRDLTATAANQLEANMDRAAFTYIPSENLGTDEETLNKKVAEKEIFAYFVIGPDPLTGAQGFKYVSQNLTDTDLRRWFTRIANRIVQERRFQDQNIDPMVAGAILSPLNFESRKISSGGKEEEVSSIDKLRQWAPVGAVYLLWIAIFMISQMLLTNTIEEKSNRIIEVLLSSISPFQLMTGKIFGIALTGLTMVLTWLLSAALGLKYLPKLVGSTTDLNLASIVGDPLFLGSFVCYFVVGYLFYAAVFAGLGSICNSLKEAQNYAQVVTFTLIVPLLTMAPIGKDPNGTLAQVLSWIPPFTPFVMLNRMAAPPTIWEYVGTSILMLVSLVFIFWAAAKVFRIGILMTGKPPKLSEILHWIKSPSGAVPVEKK